MGRRNDTSMETKNKVWSRDGGCCVWCGSRSKVTVDHIISVCLGGNHSLSNLRLLCRECDKLRHNPIVFRRKDLKKPPK